MKLTIVCASVLLALNTAHTAAQTLELKRVSLSSSGVGYFEYEAKVIGKATLSLPVALDKVDDVLKSLVVYDGQGRIGGVSLPGLDPIVQTLKQLPFDAAALNQPSTLLEALRGAEISISGKHNMRGRIVSVFVDRDTSKHKVMLATAHGMQQFFLDSAENLQFEDPVLREQISKALAALSNNRAKDARSVDIISEGNTARTVRVGYVTTVPIWKNAYRFTLPEASQKINAKANIQGWAVIENMSGQDWTNVQLTLTAGKPVAFSQQLYKSYYNTRPQVGVELPGNIVPVADQGTFKEAGRDAVAIANRQAPRGIALPSAAPAAAPAAAPMMAMAKSANLTASGISWNNGFAGEFGASNDGLAGKLSIAQAADAATVMDDSTQASYTFGLPVTVGSGRSLSIPIIQNELPMARVALYQPNVAGANPLAAIEINNTSASGMPAGAATLYEASNVGGQIGNQFVGDAQLAVLPANDKRYVAYALDQKLNIAQRTHSDNTLKGYSVKGANLITGYLYANIHTFTIKSTHNEPRDVVVEVPIAGENWILADNPAHTAIGKTASHYRRNIVAAAHETTTVSVRQEQASVQSQYIGNFDVQNLRNIAKDTLLDPKAKPVLDTVIALMDKRNDVTTQRSFIDEQLSKGRENQNRIRENLKSVPVKSEPHNRYMAELNKADAQDAQLEAQLAKVMAAKQAAEVALRDYLADLK